MRHLRLLGLNLFLANQISFVDRKIRVFFPPKSRHQSPQILRLFLVQKVEENSCERKHRE